ncbi:MAG: right-handed parallel beta-helix repeat-containing protein [Phycisphaerales bacterium]|nr:right-handed parallel beta-helix repeat-containing protein [Phycisphaerales bacterium]
MKITAGALTWMVVSFVGLVSAHGQTLIFVDANELNGGDGQSWATAFNDLQDALDMADVIGGLIEIRVADGIYYPSKETSEGVSRSVTFQLLNNCAIKGGYAGNGAPNPDARNASFYVSTLSGDLAQNDGPDFANNDENAYHVVTGSLVGPSAVLDGVTITAGHADLCCDDDWRGGGMLNIQGNPTVTNCTFDANHAVSEGAAMYNSSSFPTVSDCVFSNNASGFTPAMTNADGSNIVVLRCRFIDNFYYGMRIISSSVTVRTCTFQGNGGGITGVSSSTVTGCIFKKNMGSGIDGLFSGLVSDCLFLENNSSFLGGAGISVSSSATNPTITGCFFEDNTTSGDGGGIFGTGGSVTVTDCTFTNNTGDDGGAIRGGGTNWIVSNCVFDGNQAVSGNGGAAYNIAASDCIFMNNTASSSGGGMYSTSFSAGSADNCTFTGNTAAFHGGGVFDAAVTGCSFTNNTATAGDGGGVYGSATNCTITGNQAGDQGGGIFQDTQTTRDCFINGNTAGTDGGGLYFDSGFGSVINCTFLNNTASDDGGGLYNDSFSSSVRFANLTFLGNHADDVGGGIYNVSNRLFVNCALSGNTAGNQGGGMYNANSSADAILTNCTFNANDAVVSGGGIFNANVGTVPVLTNCILWNNTDGTGAVEAAQITDGAPDVTFSCIQDDDGPGGASTPFGGIANFNIDFDPLFVNALGTDFMIGTQDDDLRLGSTSPCREFGSAAALPADDDDLDGDADLLESIPIDLDAGAREVPMGAIDMGAYEFDDCNSNMVDDGSEIADGSQEDCNGNAIPDQCEVPPSAGCPSALCLSGCVEDNNENCVPDECESETPADIDVRVVPIVLINDPAGSALEVSTGLAMSAQAVMRGTNFFVEFWASDVGTTNTGLTSVYVDVAVNGFTSAASVTNGPALTDFPSGTIELDSVDEFGGSAVPSAGAIAPEWVRVGWIEMRADVQTPQSTLSMSPSTTGISAMTRGLIPWSNVQLDSVDVEIILQGEAFDLDLSGVIDAGDLGVFTASWLNTVPPASPFHDYDCDGFVGPGDMSFFATAWLKEVCDDSIVAPACLANVFAGGASLQLQGPPNGSPPALARGGVTDVTFDLAVLAAPSASDTAVMLPPSVCKINQGQDYFVEVWASDVNEVNSGLVCAYVDLEFPEDDFTVVSIMHTGLFDTLPSGSAVAGGVDELGGSALPNAGGIEPSLVRVAIVRLHADNAPQEANFGLSPSSTGISAFARGEISASEIAFGSQVIGNAVPGDINLDGFVDGHDIESFLDALIVNPVGPGDPLFCGSDLNGDGSVDPDDVSDLVAFLLGT